VTLSKIISGLGSSLAIIPLMAYLESISIAKGNLVLFVQPRYKIKVYKN
jgi:hypothetical protein